MLTLSEMIQLSVELTPTPIVGSHHFNFTELAPLIDAIAKLLWPILVFIIILLFKDQISNILSRLRKGKVLGQEIELEEKAEDLKKYTDEALEQLPIKSQNIVINQYTSGVSPPSKVSISQETAEDPTNALFQLGILIEQQVREILASQGNVGEYLSGDIVSNVKNLVSRGALPSSAASALTFFWQIRNQTVHGGGANKSIVLSAIDSGITLMKLLEAVPRETYVVYHPGVLIYSDLNCQNMREGVKGIILETTSSDGVTKSFRIYPTTKTYFVKGKRVSWEWNMKYVFGESWYRDPESNEIKYGWTESAEFVGRHIDEL